MIILSCLFLILVFLMVCHFSIVSIKNRMCQLEEEAAVAIRRQSIVSYQSSKMRYWIINFLVYGGLLLSTMLLMSTIFWMLHCHYKLTNVDIFFMVVTMTGAVLATMFFASKISFNLSESHWMQIGFIQIENNILKYHCFREQMMIVIDLSKPYLIQRRRKTVTTNTGRHLSSQKTEFINVSVKQESKRIMFHYQTTEDNAFIYPELEGSLLGFELTNLNGRAVDTILWDKLRTN